MFYFDFLHYHVARSQAAIERLAARGDIGLVYTVRPKSPDLPIKGCEPLFDSHWRCLVNSDEIPLNAPETDRALVRALNKDNPDVVAIPGYRTRVCRSALGWCKQNRRAAVLMSESRREDMARRWWSEQIKRMLVSQFDAALVGGRAHARYAVELGIPVERVFTGYDVVDNTYWQTRALEARRASSRWRQEYHLPERYWIASGRFIPKKNFERLLYAYALYRQQMGESAWHLILSGTGPLEVSLRQIIQEQMLGEFVHLPGYLSADQLGIYYGLANAFVMPSSHNEQWGLVVNEAMAAGLPVLVSRTVGCAPELVCPGVNGFTFDPYDVQGLADLMAHLSQLKEEERVAMGNASQRIIAEWSLDRFASSLLQAAEAGLQHVAQSRTPNWVRQAVSRVLSFA